MPNAHQENDIFANIPKKNASSENKKVKPEILPTSRPSSPQPQTQYTRKEKSLRTLWTVTALISMTVNIVVVVLLGAGLYLYSKNVNDFEMPEGIDMNTPLNLLQGLYDNFQLMDEAHIETNIVVEDTIPVQFDLMLNQPTVVTLTEAVTIYGAYVEINTGALNISAPAVVTLPKDLDLPILLDLVVPVDTTIPVKLDVAVDIPLKDTDLHEPFVGLQEVVRPLYCLVAPDAVSIHGEAICP
ncbi:MAG TPA: hypothetical protein EYP74_06450 [Anaerolineales bacterium]|nr:hypothetical protein [Anaerolineales bacterium]